MRTKYKVCLHPSSLCDRIEDCSTGEYEQLCTINEKCPQNCECLLYAMKCTNTSILLLKLHNIVNFIYLKFVNVSIHNRNMFQIKTEALLFIWRNSYLHNVCQLLKCTTGMMQYLDFGFNQIKTLEQKCFHGCIHLKILLLNNNKVIAIDSLAFHGLKKLIKLDISCNNLKKFSQEKFGYLKLHVINITHNSITHIDPDIVIGLEAKEVITDDYRDMLSDGKIRQSLYK